jgi:hypothetical protein
VATFLACQQYGSEDAPRDPSPLPARGEAVFADDFESGTLDAWQDGMDATRHRVVVDPASARSGRHYLVVTYPAGRDGGWLTRFLAPGYESLYASYYARFPSGWKGGTKLIALYGSRTDDPWSALERREPVRVAATSLPQCWRPNRAATPGRCASTRTTSGWLGRPTG